MTRQRSGPPPLRSAVLSPNRVPIPSASARLCVGAVREPPLQSPLGRRGFLILRNWQVHGQASCLPSPSASPTSGHPRGVPIRCDMGAPPDASGARPPPHLKVAMAFCDALLPAGVPCSWMLSLQKPASEASQSPRSSSVSRSRRPSRGRRSRRRRRQCYS